MPHSDYTRPTFPYMAWAHGPVFQSPWFLGQSGMPAPSAEWAHTGPDGLDPPTMEALPALEARLGDLFGVPAERIFVTPGASSAMALAALHFFPDSRVVTESPSYEPFRSLPLLTRSPVAVVERHHSQDWILDPDRMRTAAPGGNGPLHLFLANPHNPTGVVADAVEVRARADLAAESGGVLISNEVYMEFASPPDRVHAFSLAPNTVSIGSLTKAYGLGALRIGWLVLGEEVASQRAAIQELAYLLWVDPPTPSLKLALCALNRLEELLAPLRSYEALCRPHLERWLETNEEVEGTLGPLGLVAFPRVLGVESTAELARFLAEEHGVGVVPGEFFGCPGHIRVGFGVPEATLTGGLERLSAGLAAWRSAH